MKRTPFKRKTAPAMRVAKQVGPEYNLRPHAPAVAIAQDDRLTVAVPKFTYVRDERLRDMCRAMPCQRCAWGTPDAGVTWAHSNLGRHGKGRSIKASDVYVAAMCARCHARLDQGNDWDADEKELVWLGAWRNTVKLALKWKTWPAGIEVPDLEEGSR